MLSAAQSWLHVIGLLPGSAAASGSFLVDRIVGNALAPEVDCEEACEDSAGAAKPFC
jgi:hypothetical protein